MEEVKLYFEALRFDPKHHLGLGDIRLTISQQDEIVLLIEQKLNKHSAHRFRDLIYEQDLPEDMTDDEFDIWYKESHVVDGVRMGLPFNRKYL